MVFRLSALLPLFLSANALSQDVIAHRGASADAPENTLAAFHLAWEQGADGIEGDFYLSRDGQIVCIHDATTERTAGKNLKVAGSSAAELRALDVGTWKGPAFAGEKIPLLGEVLATVPERKQIFIEVKCGPEIVPKLKAEIRASTLDPRQISIIAFDAEVVTACRAAMPTVNANWLTSFKLPEGESAYRPSTEDIMATLGETGATGLGANANIEATASLPEKLRAINLEFHLWTINEPTSAKHFQQLGARSITTDRPGDMRGWLGLGQ